MIDASTPQQENPAGLQMQAQLEVISGDLHAIAEQRGAGGQKLVSYEVRIAKIPLVEREYLHLTRLRETANRKFQEIKSVEMSARIDDDLESEQTSERYSQIEPLIVVPYILTRAETIRI